MRDWFRGKRGGLFAFLAIAALVAGGLGSVTVAALRLESEQLAERDQRELYDRLRLALWRLDSLVAPALAKEEGRPYNHYSALYAPPHVLQIDSNTWQKGTVLAPSPLLSAELPEWMLLHFQADPQTGWRSPQVPSQSLIQRLQGTQEPDLLANVTPQRRQLLQELTGQLAAKTLALKLHECRNRPSLQDVTVELDNNFVLAPDNSAPLANASSPQQSQARADPEYLTRSRQVLSQSNRASKSQNEDANIADINTLRNGEIGLLQDKGKRLPSQPIPVSLGPMVAFWLTGNDQQERLVCARHVTIGTREVCQGIILDGPRLQEILALQVRDLFPAGQIEPVHEEVPSHSERTMSALPFQLDPGPLSTALSSPGWTSLRIGLVLAWSAALVALLAVGLGGWLLIDLSERRIRFVSAVTHELRTPLTTLRLYLDMLAGGMIRDEKQKDEYLHTLNAEADRLNRLVGNVLDFSRLENQRPRLEKTRVKLQGLLEQVHADWHARCEGAGKELHIDNSIGGDAYLFTDSQLVQQILGNLVDNACKYSQAAQDRRIWLRACRESHQLALEVEDSGPGVPHHERRAIFRPFRRGKTIDVTAGGVGLGLALAYRWTQLLGGRLSCRPGRDHVGACFRIELPLTCLS